MDRVITAIRVQKRNPQRINVDLDGEFSFGLSRFVGAWLTVGEHLTEEQINALIQQDAVEVAYQRALSLLDYRPRTEKEIRQKLSGKDFTEDQVNEVVEKLQHAGLIQDQDYARMWVENRNSAHPRSKKMIRYELRSKGIKGETIDAALEGSADDGELAYLAASHYVHRLTGCDWLTFRKRLSGFLARRGFSYGTIAPVVRSLWQQRSTTQGNTEEENEEVEK